ncbi:hypothetical protein EG346_07840 [Chryseobacterium carnipullorum]|uniref:DUF4292 domain-containing protein n=2 Tax=Chryseobacterium carnipullorum TaxID=1124835 RepID=A0A376EV85_CHRCU|nr:hypothetical protein [Chryseobacterium carnipullorum]AZA48110.1 hypothetical protein EG346_07840 [Chryseobacterium carnipullorum]AZA67422.1 hypothetical protein EG345_24025 [Chryseobacterium carnipullorum]STD14012.1 Uncharacterised protein [Chryseobacterium carnipullorum]
MIKQMKFLWATVLLIILQSCSINTETTYYKDAATSMKSNILMDKNIMGMMSMMGSDPKKLSELDKLPTDWTSLYTVQKHGKVTLNEDSAKVLKKVYMKVDKDKDEIVGLSLKYDKLMPSEITQLLASDKRLKKIPLQDIAVWNGQSLIINTYQFNSDGILKMLEEKDSEEKTVPKTKSDSIEAYGKQMASGMAGMLRMFNLTFTNTLKFQKPIKNIEGKHDFVKQVDNKTVQITVRSNDLVDGKNLINKDKKVIITTE